jgi:hypothetical protein
MDKVHTTYTWYTATIDRGTTVLTYQENEHQIS